MTPKQRLEARLKCTEARLQRAVGLLSRYYWVQSWREGEKVDEAAADFFCDLGEGWRRYSLDPPADGEADGG